MSTAAKEMGRGTLWIFLAEALAVPAGLFIARLLTTTLGPAGYGRYGVAAAVVLATEWLIVAAYSRISVQLLSETRTRSDLEPSVMRHYLFTGLGAMALFLLGANVLASALHAPSLAADLRWLSLDVPLFALAYAQRSIMTARGEYSGRASAIVIRWVSRVAFTWGLLALGLGMLAPLWAWSLSSVAEIGCLRRLPLRFLMAKRKAPATIWREGWAPFLFAAGQRSLERADLLLLQVLGTAAPAVGVYVAAQNLSILPGLFAVSLTPVLTATMTRERLLGRELASRRGAASALKVTLYLLPLAAIFSQCGGDIAAFAFGSRFRSAGPLTGWLIVAYIGMALASTAASILCSQGRHRLTAYLSLPAAACAAALHLLVIPRYGMQGAAMVSAGVGLASGLVAMSVVYRLWRQRFPFATVFRAAVSTLVVLALAKVEVFSSLQLPTRICWLLLASGMTLLAAGEWRSGIFAARFGQCADTTLQPNTLFSPRKLD